LMLGAGNEKRKRNKCNDYFFHVAVEFWFVKIAEIMNTNSHYFLIQLFPQGSNDPKEVRHLIGLIRIYKRQISH